MGNQKQKWTSEEEEALRAGVAKHGTGKWKNILTDPQFAPSLVNRSNIDLKDKWRNLSVSGNASGSREKVKLPKLQGLTIDPPSNSPIPSSDVLLLEYDCTADPSKSSLDKKIAPKYNAMIFEALSSTEDSNGLDVNAIHSFIEQRHEVPQSFRRLLTSKLRRLVLQGKLEKIDNWYKIKDPSSETEAPKEEEDIIRPNNNNNNVENSNEKQKTVQSYVSPTAETVEDAAFCAAYRVAEAENKSYVAAEAFKEADRISKIAEEAEVMLELATEIYEQCSRDGMVLLAA